MNTAKCKSQSIYTDVYVVRLLKFYALCIHAVNINICVTLSSETTEDLKPATYDISMPYFMHVHNWFPL